MTESSFKKDAPVEKSRDGTYGLHDRAFEPLAKEDPAVVRRRDVKQFRASPVDGQQPRWNASTVDEAHPFPQRAQNHTIATYQGVDVVTSHFPERVKNTAHLRNAPPPQWDANATKATALSRYTYQCDALKNEEPPLSYLAQTIVEDNTAEKQARRNGWQASTLPEGHAANRFVAEKGETNYTELNKTKLGIMTESNYVPPEKRVKDMNMESRRQKQMQRDAQQETNLTLYETAGAPKTFTMKNKKEWMDMDPVAVAAAQAEKKDELGANPYTVYGQYTMKTKKTQQQE